MNKTYSFHLGDCLDSLRAMPDCSVDSIVTDPPYGLAFMGKRWDYDVPGVDVWAECLRVLKPGGHLLAFAGTRTQHRMAVRIEDAGFEIRDMIAWVYGSGFPKSHNLQDDWQGWGTALKPALEPITVARKQLIGTVAENVLKHGTGALNIDGCRVEGGERPLIVGENDARKFSGDFKQGSRCEGTTIQGRWPANLIHDGSDEVVGLFPESKDGVAGKRSGVAHVTLHGLGARSEAWGGYGGGGSAARFFYCAKASRADRNEGLTDPGPQFKHGATLRQVENTETRGNHHPTVKPTDLMAYLVRLVTPPGGVVLDPFMGSGSTGKAAVREGFRFIGCEMNPEYLAIAEARIAHELARIEAERVSAAAAVDPQFDLFAQA